MIKKILISILFASIFVFTFAISYGQDAMQPQLFFVEDVIIKPSEGDNFQKVIKEFLDYFEEYNFQFEVNSYMTNDFHVYFTFPVKDLADIGNLFTAFNDFQGKIGEQKWAELLERENRCIESLEYGLYHYRPDLSYLPENPRLAGEEAKYMALEFAYVNYGMEAEADAIWKEWIELYKDKGITDPFYTWVGFIGPEIPVYLFSFFAKDAIDYQQASAAIMEKLGDVDVLYENTLKIIKKMELKTGEALFDLMYAPEDE